MDTNKIKTQLKRVMSDRALKIVKCSQTKVKQLNDSLNLSSSQNDLSMIIGSNLQNKLNSRLLNSSILNLNKNNSNNNKITLQPIKIVDIKDKESLINHIKSVYKETIKSDGNSIVFGVQSIINSILHFIKSSNNIEKITINDFLKEHLLQTIIQLNLKYKDDRQCEEMRIEGQIQILLKIEDILQKNNKAIDDDDVWEIANLIRWLNQLFKDKFKIEKFLFGEIYSNYFTNSPEFLLSLMEELGYDNSQNDDDTNSEDGDDTNETNDSINDKKPLNNDDSLISNNSSATNLNNSDSFDASKSLFDINTNSDDLLNDLRRKKMLTRFPSSTANTSRSIMVQKKRLHLKIRSPYKSPSKTGSRHVLPNSDYIRRSPRLKDKPSLKRSNQISITDTPIHKQNSTRMKNRQQRLIRKISFQKFKSEKVIIPDTPEKNKNETIGNRFIIRASPSPKKSPKKMRFN